MPVRSIRWEEMNNILQFPGPCRYPYRTFLWFKREKKSFPIKSHVQLIATLVIYVFFFHSIIYECPFVKSEILLGICVNYRMYPLTSRHFPSQIGISKSAISGILISFRISCKIHEKSYFWHFWGCDMRSSWNAYPRAQVLLHTISFKSIPYTFCKMCDNGHNEKHIWHDSYGSSRAGHSSMAFTALYSSFIVIN